MPFYCLVDVSVYTSSTAEITEDSSILVYIGVLYWGIVHCSALSCSLLVAVELDCNLETPPAVNIFQVYSLKCKYNQMTRQC